MSKKLSSDELKALINKAINSLQSTFNQLLDSDNDTENHKKASLLAYWIYDYIKYINTEKQFKPMSLLKYNRGDIIQVHFGYRIGSELGGLHYAIVLDKNNSKSSPVITVLPLKSLKPTFRMNNHQYILKTGLYKLMESSWKNLHDELLPELDNLKDLVSDNNVNLKDLSNKFGEMEKKYDHWNKISKSLEKLKLGTVADIGQITTISKMRISNPKNKNDSLYKISLTSEDMNDIDEAIKDIFGIE